MPIVNRPYLYALLADIDPAQVTANEVTLYDLVNGLLDDANIATLAEAKVVMGALGHAHSGGTGGAPIQLVKGTDIASAASIAIPTDGNYFDLTGTATITALGTRNAGVLAIVRAVSTPTFTHNATTLKLFGAANYVARANDVLALVSLGAGNWQQIAGPTKNIAPTIQIITATGTWTKPVGLAAVLVQLVGSGGGGAGGSATDGGAGGGSGGYSQKRIAAASLGATETVTVGAAGGGGATSGAGGNGGTVSFGAHCSATGGVGGSHGGNGGDGGAGATGDINSAGGPGLHTVGGNINGYNGGSSFFGGGGRGPTSGVGGAGSNGGGGGGGGGNNAGGAGGAGRIIVTEYY